MNKIASIWDFDGTIVYSWKTFYRPFPILFEKYHIRKEVLDPDLYHEVYYGRAIEAVLREYIGPEIDRDTCLAMAEDYVDLALEMFKAAPVEDVPLIHGVRRVLDFFAEHECPMAIASSSTMPTLVTVLEKHGMLEYFTNLISGHMLPAKPEPDVFLTAAASLGMNPKNCVVFEDSLAGMKGAKNAGMKCVGIASTVPISRIVDADIPLETYDTLTFEAIQKLFE